MAEVAINLILLQEEDKEKRRQMSLFQRILRDRSNPMDLPDGYFKKYFRLSKESALYLINRLSLYMRNNEKITAVPKILRVLAALHLYGNGGYQFGIGQAQILAMSQPTISRAISEVTDAIIQHLLEEWINFPTDNLSKNQIQQGFLEKFGFVGVIGAIDCTHIAIIAPPENDPNFPARVYFNRKGYTSINTQIICDSNLKILNINARYPGSTHDSAIWMTSSIKRHLQEKYLQGGDTTYLLGDSGYPLQPWLLTPFDNPAPGSREELYNNLHCSTRNTIERVNGVLKSRFRCLLRHRTLNYDPVKAGNIIYACAVLHNICINFHDEPPDELNDEIDDNDIIENNVQLDNIRGDRNWHAEGEMVRNNVLQFIDN